MVRDVGAASRRAIGRASLDGPASPSLCREGSSQPGAALQRGSEVGRHSERPVIRRGRLLGAPALSRTPPRLLSASGSAGRGAQPARARGLRRTGAPGARRGARARGAARPTTGRGRRRVSRRTARGPAAQARMSCDAPGGTVGQALGKGGQPAAGGCCLWDCRDAGDALVRMARQRKASGSSKARRGPEARPRCAGGCGLTKGRLARSP